MTNNLRVKLLTTDEVSTIYDKCLDFLSSKGVEVDHPQALKIFDKAGAWVDFSNQQVRFPKDIIEMALRTVPHALTLAGRNEHHDLIIPHPRGLFYTRTGGGARSYLAPHPSVYRDVTLADVREWAQLVEALEQVSICAMPTPRDVPEETVDIHALKAVFENTSKHIQARTYSFESLEYQLELALVMAGSKEALKKRPIMHITTRSLTPFVFKPMALEAIIQAPRYGLPLGLSCLPNAGGTSPITIAGTALQNGIEILAQLVMSQLIEPGMPVYTLCHFFTLDMLTGRTLQSSVEAMLGAATNVQFIKDAFQIPTQTYGFGTDSPTPDGQCMTEVALRGLLLSMVGCDILAGAGQLNVVTTMSPVQLIVDNVLAGILKRVISGVKVDDDTLAWKDIFNTVPGGHYLERVHTLQHCRDALRPKLFVSQPMEVWSLGGSKDLYTRAVEEYRELKKRLQPQQLSEDVQKELNRIVKQADERLVK